MKSLICLLACVAYVRAGLLAPLAVPVGLTGIHDDGQWRPELDGSWLGTGLDGQWNPLLDNSLAGLSPNSLLGHGGVVALRSLGGHAIGKRSAAWVGHAGVINPNALNVPLDEIHVAAAKKAQLISQATEGSRNILGGGIPLALPADTHEVAIGKQAHAIAHATEKAAAHWTNGGNHLTVSAAPLVAVSAIHAVPVAAVSHSAQLVAPVTGVWADNAWGTGLGGHGWAAPRHGW